MNAQQIQNEIERLYYWDARVLRLDSSYFGDELTLVFEDSDYNKKIQFSGCSKILFSTSVNDRIKPLRDFTKPQIHYFIQDVEITDFELEGWNLLKCKLFMPPLSVEISCRKIIIDKE